MQFHKMTMLPASFGISSSLPSIWNSLISSVCYKSFFIYILWVSPGKPLSNFLCSCLLIWGMEAIMYHHIRLLQLLFYINVWVWIKCCLTHGINEKLYIVNCVWITYTSPSKFSLRTQEIKRRLVYLKYSQNERVVKMKWEREYRLEYSLSWGSRKLLSEFNHG